MVGVLHRGKRYELEHGESVLDGILRQGGQAPHACRAGACQSCLMQARCGKVDGAAQVGLKETLRAQGYFLACLCRPEDDLEVQEPGAEVRVQATLIAIDRLSASVVRVRLRPEREWDYRSGQYVVMLREGVARSYSLASLPSDDALEIHVRKIAGGRMSTWLYDEARIGDSVELQGPAGDCFYVPGRPEQPLLLAGTGTGVAPLYGIVRDALSNGHTGPIWLFHGAVDREGIYLDRELRRIVEQAPHFRYRPSTLRDAPRGGAQGPLDELVLRDVPKSSGFRVFLCGAPDLVRTLKKKIFMAGASAREIHADPFLPSAS